MYNGGKNGSGTYQTIINQIPFHDIYIEPFLGSGAVYLNKFFAKISFLCDMVPAHRLPCFNQISPGDIFYNGDAITFLEISGNILQNYVTAGKKIFAYLDPPYPMSARSHQKKIYEYEMSDQDHIRLLTVARSLNFPVAISTYDNDIYSDMLSTWRKISFKSMTRAGMRTEILYMNYPIPAVLHDYRYIGKDFREREKYKLIKRNFLSKLNRMPAMVRNSILSDITRLKK